MAKVKVCIVDFNFLLRTAEYNIINECTITDCNEEDESQTFHISCGKKTLEHLKKIHFRQLNYNKVFYHDMPLDFGSIKFHQFRLVLEHEMDQFDIVYLKGTEKVKMFKSLVNNDLIAVRELQTADCPSLEELVSKCESSQKSCSYHPGKYPHCTAFKAGSIFEWMKRNHKSR